MSKIFVPNANGIIYMDAQDADRYDGSLVRWDLGSGNTLIPTGDTWNRSAAAKLIFNFDPVSTRTYSLFLLFKGSGGGTRFWIDLNHQQQSTPNNYGTGGDPYINDSMQWIGDNSQALQVVAGINQICIQSIDDSMELWRIAMVPTGQTTITNGMTGYGESQQFADAQAQAVEDTESYAAWLEDDSRNPHRVLLLEMNFGDGDGVVRFGSQAWLSDKNLPYDDGILSDPYIEETIDGTRSVGDVEVIVEEPEINLAQQVFRGQQSRWLYGDTSWNTNQFKTLSTSIIEQCKMTGYNRFQFDLLPPSDVFFTTFYEGDDANYSGTFAGAINYIKNLFTSCPPIRYLNVIPDDTYVVFTLTENLEFATILQQLCNSIGAVYRISNADGVLEIIRPDDTQNPVLEFNNHNIIDNSLQVQSITPAYQFIEVIYGLEPEDGDRPSITQETGANTGTFEETFTIDTVLENSADATPIVNKYSNAYAEQQILYSFEADGVNVDFAAVGDKCIINHFQVSGIGVIQTVRRTFLGAPTIVEVLI